MDHVPSRPGTFRLDASFEQFVTLADGRELRVRWIRPADAALIREGFTRLSLESRFMRFFRPLRELPDNVLRYLTEVDGVNHAAIIATSGPDGAINGERGFGVARFVRSVKDPTSAELAITVTDDAQGLGLGRALLRALARAARERSVETFEMSVLSRNARVRRLLHRAGARRRGGDWEVSEYLLETSAFV